MSARPLFRACPFEWLVGFSPDGLDPFELVLPELENVGGRMSMGKEEIGGCEKRKGREDAGGERGAGDEDSRARPSSRAMQQSLSRYARTEMRTIPSGSERDGATEEEKREGKKKKEGKKRKKKAEMK